MPSLIGKVYTMIAVKGIVIALTTNFTRLTRCWSLSVEEFLVDGGNLAENEEA